MSAQSTSIVSGPCEIGLARQATKTTGTNSSNAFFILTRRYQSDPKRGDHCHRGVHDKLLTDNALQIMMQTMMKIMRTAAMQAAITVSEIARAITTKDHTGEDNANTLPCRGEPPPVHEQQRLQFNPPPPAQYNPKQWLNNEDFCIQVGHSMFQSLAILGLGLGASETEIKVHYRQLARKYHPDKNDTAITGLTTSEASTFFQLLNNAHQYLKDYA